MKTSEFLQLLDTHKDTSLLFEYAPSLLVGANYHITEVKHITVDSVDCGARTDAWKETIVQLWESPSEIGKTEYMSTYKAAGILKKVAQMKSFEGDAELKIEYSNPLFHTAQLFINDYEIHNNQLLFKLAVQKTDCKAKEECGVDVVASNTPNEEILVTSEACCEPGGGCC